MFEITVLDCEGPPLHLYVYTSCERPSIYGQLKNTNNHLPPVKNLLLLSAKFCNAFVYAHAAFWLPVYYSSVSAEPMGIWPIPKRCQAFFSSLFLSVTSLCIPLKHTDPCLVCSLGGTHHRQRGWNTRCTRFDGALWTCIKGRLWSWIPSDGVILRDPFNVMKRWPVMALHFQSKSVISQLKLGVCPQELNQI